ncbi:16S ribosomal RNA methyltransferase KsgA/Dim1 family protein [Candidatus Mycoplasma haematolamae str. Purdue]|uniref:16S ribosomal RNA methyltransferase KsgA/Dim1 family protein n=1 Tax=Mycoplasma haematolamae (strain Purdue) TaxID=1212765 RepID=I7C7I5_MYCHA|nr:16S ribosomal RNA methyltransferase KsgA/Dim1 family protein [Candidatus Mycoplasma haematolamae str. Purdue]
MKLKPEDLPKDHKEILLAGNIPYYISTEIFKKFLRVSEFREAYMMVQKEFFEVISSSFNTRQYSSLAVLFQSFCDVKKLFEIGRLNFFPKPNVDSVFLSLKKNEQPSNEFLESYSLFVKRCFSKPRKTLWNNLSSESFDRDKFWDLIKARGLTENVRAHQLSPKEILELFKTYLQLNS